MQCWRDDVHLRKSNILNVKVNRGVKSLRNRGEILYSYNKANYSAKKPENGKRVYRRRILRMIRKWEGIYFFELTKRHFHCVFLWWVERLEVECEPEDCPLSLNLIEAGCRSDSYRIFHWQKRERGCRPPQLLRTHFQIRKRENIIGNYSWQIYSMMKICSN